LYYDPFHFFFLWAAEVYCFWPPQKACLTALAGLKALERTGPVERNDQSKTLLIGYPETARFGATHGYMVR
jgi:hypothetical protein